MRVGEMAVADPCSSSFLLVSSPSSLLLLPQSVESLSAGSIIFAFSEAMIHSKSSANDEPVSAAPLLCDKRVMRALVQAIATSTEYGMNVDVVSSHEMLSRDSPRPVISRGNNEDTHSLIASLFPSAARFSLVKMVTA